HRRPSTKRPCGGGPRAGNGAGNTAGFRGEGRAPVQVGQTRLELACAAQSRSADQRGNPMEQKIAPDEGRAIRRHLLGGIVIALLLTVGIGGWATTTELSGAVIAPGSIVVDSNVKKVQHLTGGIVGELLVRDGQRVRAGEVVVRLDETITRVNLAIVTKG